MDRCYALAYRILRDPHRAQDATQQALLGAWRDLPTLRDPERFDAWLYRLIVRACADVGRRRRRWRSEIAVLHTEPFEQDVASALADRDQLDPMLDACVATYVDTLDEDGQVDFKGKAKAFVRTYGFLASVLPFSNAAWEKLSIFLNFLIPKLPAPKEEDLSKGILEAIDMDSYRVEVRAAMPIALADEDAEIAPVPTTGGGRMREELTPLDRQSSGTRSEQDRCRSTGRAGSPPRSACSRRRPPPGRSGRGPTATTWRSSPGPTRRS